MGGDTGNTRKKSRAAAALLSAFACPGAGQIYKGHRVRGGIMAALALVLVTAIIVKVWILLFGMTVNMGPEEILGDVLGIVHRMFAMNAVFFKLTGYGFLAVWAYSIIDALAAKPV